MIVTGSVVCDPPHPRLSQGRDDFRVEDTNGVSGDVMPVHADNPSVFSSRLEILQKIRPVGRVHSL